MGDYPLSATAQAIAMTDDTPAVPPPAEEIQEILHRLEQAVRDHGAWLMMWHRSIICSLPLGEQHMADDAHRRCNFGIWYYQEAPDYLRQFGVFDQIGDDHRQMHRRARELSQLALDTHGITTSDYDQFLNQRSEFRELVRVLEKKLQDLLFHTDPLTRVYNRQRMLPMLAREQERAIGADEPCVIGMVDLDHFKSVNDTHGHPAGDAVLKHVALFFATHLRPSDLIFRYGGEEFLLCLPDTNIHGARRVLDRLRRELAEEQIDIGNGVTLQVTSSFGITAVEKDLTLEELIARADQAVYTAKTGGRNQVCAWAPG